MVFFYRVLPSFFGVHLVTSSAKRFLPSFYRVFTEFYRVSSACTWLHRVLGFTEFYWVLPSFTGFYWVERRRDCRGCRFAAATISWPRRRYQKPKNKQTNKTKQKKKNPKNSFGLPSFSVSFCFFFLVLFLQKKTRSLGRYRPFLFHEKPPKWPRHYRILLLLFFFKPNCLRFSLEFYRLLPSLTEF